LKSIATRFTSGILFGLLLTAPAFAQYGGSSSGSSSPSYGSGKAAAAGVGAAGAGAAILYLTLHNRGSLTGCVQGGDDAWSLVDDSKHQTYSLVPGGTALHAGQRVQLKGKKSKNNTGAQTFQVSKVVKNLGNCSTQSAVNSSQSGGSPRNSAEN
jgi:hypothetical protein